MNKKSKFVIYTLATLLVFLCIEIFYIYSTKSVTPEMLNSKLAFVKLSGMPDLAISSDSIYIRDRSLSSIFSIYSEDPTLREYSSSTFVYSHSHIKASDEF